MVKRFLCALFAHPSNMTPDFEKKARQKLRDMAQQSNPPMIYVRCWCGRTWRPVVPDYDQP